MKIPMLDSLLEQYNDLSERTQSELSTMLNVVSGKYIPGTSQISTISDSLNQLYEMYEQIYDSVQTMLPEEEMPSKEKSVSELIETLVSSKMQLLDRARAVLSRFTCVEAVSEAYSQAIAPYQQEAELMLGKAENPEEIVIDEVAVISEAAFAPEIFLQALDTDDFDTDDEIELLEQVGQYYPLRVQVGLAQKKFFQTTAPEETQSEKPSDILSEEVQPEEACSFPDGGEPESDSCVPDAGTEAGEQPLSEANEPEILPEAIEAEPETSDLSDEEKKLPASELEEAPVSEEESADEAAEPKSAPEHEPVLVGVVPADHTAAFQGIVSEIIPETEEPVEEPVEEPEEETAETGTKEDETEETSETVTSAYETEEERDDADDDNDNDEEDRAVDIHIDGLPEYMEQLCEHISESHTFTEYKSKKAEKSFGVKSFKSDLKGPSLALRVIVMNDIFNNVCIDEERIAFMNKQPLFKLSAEAECEYLCNKGYLKKYVLDDEKSMYCLTGKGLKAYASKDSASFLKMKKAKDRTELEISTSESAILHLLYAKGIVHAAESEANGTDTAISCTRSEKSFIYRVTPKDGTPHIYTALLEQEMDEISTYFLNLSEHIQETDSAQISILGYNCEHAEHIRSVLEKAQLCSVSSIYSFVDDRWYGGGGSDPSPEPENTLEDEENVPDPEETACTEEMSSLTEELQPENTEPKETVETEMVTCTKELPDASSESEDAEEDTKAVSDSEKDLETEITTPEKSADENETEVSVAAAPEMKKILPEKEDAPEETVVPQPEPEKIEVSAEQTAAAAEEGEDEEAVPTEEMLSDESELEPLPEEADKSRQEITDICMSMICADKLYCASAYLKTMSLWKPEIQPMYKQLAYAINDPLEENCSYTSAALIDIFYSTLDETGVMSDYCLASALIRNYFMDHIRYDYNMQSLQDIAKNNAVICGNSNLNQIVYELYQFKENSKSGADRYADYRVKEKMEMEVKLNDIIREANEYYTNYIEGNIVERGSHKRFIHTQRLVFAKDGYLGECLKITADNDTNNLELVKHFLQENFIKDDSPIDPVNIDTDKLDAYINDHWNEAGKYVSVMRKSSDLMGSFRGNLFQRIQKTIKVMAKWVMLMDTASFADNDEGYTRYKKFREPLLFAIDTAIGTLTNELADQKNRKKDETAGRKVLLYTLAEIRRRLDGTYTEDEHKFFYADFLKGKHVLLNQAYLPNIRESVKELTEFLPTERIYAHYLEEEMTETERLQEIFERDDDFGIAQLLLNQALAKGTDLSELGEIPNLTEAIQGAEKRAENARNNFIENLELQQSYGQIENTLEDKKDKILTSVNLWFLKCSETSNFGYFSRILKAFEDKIKKEAKVREETICKELENYCNQHPELLKNASDEEDEKYKKYRMRLEKIHEMISQQNYTVAEDLIHRLPSDEEELELELLQNDYLQQFIDSYDYNSRIVSDSGRPLVSIVPFQGHKDTRGAKRLAENWLTNGGHMGVYKLISLLSAMGFSINGVTEESKKLSKYETYHVRLNEAKSNNYAHPIAAFGSSAVETGFRVVCLYGKFNADGLLNAFHEMDNTKHTLVLLDYVLPPSERRRLARKIKEDFPLKIFAVVDRVVLMYLIHNYADAASMVKKLMAVTIPYSFYQPYVVKSADVMPPEIFIGRKEELRKIEDAKGVNIVYGGRQLGKSALLRMAKNNINFNKENHRAVLVDIKGKDEKEAARKISQALSDEGVFSVKVDTDDWDELGRAIKKRLISESEPKIPYLLLLLDEADTFIESSALTNYHAFDALKDIQSIGEERFKFVVAGLRNIVRFNRDKALTNNSGLIQLESITVKPFNVMEAKELLEIPLFYLGLRFPKEKDALVSMILASSNYFPGLIQLYCSKLLEAMRKPDYAGYSENDTPPYIVSEKHIKKVISDKTFQDDVRDKFFITLKVADDDYYYIIALLMAYLYYESNKNDYAPKDVWTLAHEFEVEKITKLTLEQLTALMEEMKELNVFRVTMSGGYLFTRYSFFQMLGTKKTIEEEIWKYMEG